jgi:putative transposase
VVVNFAKKNNYPQQGGRPMVRKDFEVSRISRFRYRTRYFTDSGIIGSKEFVAENYQRFKLLFYSKHEKKPKPIKGLEGMYSLKRLSERI